MQGLALVTILAIAAPISLCAQSAADTVSSLAGQRLILVAFDGESRVRLNRTKLERHHGGCDVAVLVRAADFSHGSARFNLDYVGLPSLANAAPTTCPRVVTSVDLSIAGFADNEDLAALSAALKQVLQTPEQYLNEHGIDFHLTPGPDEQLIAPKAGDAPKQAPNLLLRVDGAYTDQARRARLNGVVTIRLVVGSDGRVHQPEIVHGLGMGLDESALEALRLWRFEPAHQDSRTIPARATMNMTFRIY